MRTVNWPKIPIEKIYLGLYDGPHATPKPASDGPIFLGIKNITEDGRLNLSQIRHIAEEDFSNWTRRVLPRPKDIVFSYEATLNLYAMIPEGFKGCLGRRLALIRPNPAQVDANYLFYYFFSDEWRTTIATKQIWGSTVDRIPLVSFPKFEITLPPLPTQRKIASILSAYDDLIENNTRRIAILEEMAQSLYHEWFVKFRFPGHEQVKPLVDFGLIVTGKTPSKLIQTYFDEKYMPFIKTPDMHGNLFCLQTEEYLSESGALSQNKKTLPPNSICVSCIGTAGVVSITSSYSQTNQQINSIILKDLSNLEFLYFALVNLREIINLYGSNGATMVNLNKGKFEALNIVYPQKDFLNHFHEKTSSIFNQIKVLHQKNINLRRTRDLLLPKLISGEIDVSGWVEDRELDKELEAVGAVPMQAPAWPRWQERVRAEPIDQRSLTRQSLWE